jgi:SAM-dependent methyltransferase
MNNKASSTPEASSQGMISSSQEIDPKELVTSRFDYWENEYNNVRALPPPSQFAAFICQEASPRATIIEFGCGSGRDIIFFAQQGFKTIGVDASSSSIRLCEQIAVERGVEGIHLLQSDVRDAGLSSCILEKLHDQKSAEIIIYSRFFLHAITNEDEDAFLALAARLGQGAVKLACEFRTPRDIYLKKETNAHYRRFVDPYSFVARSAKYGFNVVYAIEGFGFAKYKHDDAYVARLIFTRSD